MEVLWRQAGRLETVGQQPKGEVVLVVWCCSYTERLFILMTDDVVRQAISVVGCPEK